MKRLMCRTCSTTEQKAINHCFCEGCERSSKGYAEEERSRVVVAPNYYFTTYTSFLYLLFYFCLIIPTPLLTQPFPLLLYCSTIPFNSLLPLLNSLIPSNPTQTHHPYK